MPVVRLVTLELHALRIVAQRGRAWSYRVRTGQVAALRQTLLDMEGQSAIQSLGADQRNALAAQGATLLLLDVPAGTTIGIDFTSYTAGDKFAGLKMIPPGLHFLSYCAAAALSLIHI